MKVYLVINHAPPEAGEVEVLRCYTSLRKARTYIRTEKKKDAYTAQFYGVQKIEVE